MKVRHENHVLAALVASALFSSIPASATDFTGTLYYTNYQGGGTNVNKVPFFYNDVTFIATLGAKAGVATTPGADGIIFAPNGNLLIADGYRNARVLEYSPDGKKLREWGSAGTGPGQFRLPHSIQVDDNGVIYVADRENGRIQRFDRRGTYLGEWSQYGKTFGLKLVKDAMWLSSIPRGPNGAPGWLIKVDRMSGTLLGSVDAVGNHGMDVMASGDLLQAPGPNQIPQLYRAQR